ncbi:MAG TPA: DUF2087 domain-containing protein [Acidobacteriota bacterium]|nr:DUF2087 domain-containing protein [Acidobacteriota bacterium]
MEYTAGVIKETEFFTTAELAQKLKMNVQVIARKVQSGEISAYKLGKEWRIPEQSVFQWLQKHANTRPAGKKDKVLSAFVKNDHVERLPAQRSKRKYLLEYILAQFEPNRVYTEDEVNRIVTRHHADVCTVRREFVLEKMMDRLDGKYRRRTGYRFSD